MRVEKIFRDAELITHFKPLMANSTRNWGNVCTQSLLLMRIDNTQSSMSSEERRGTDSQQFTIQSPIVSIKTQAGITKATFSFLPVEQKKVPTEQFN